MLGHKDILKMGNPILRQVAEPFTHEEIKSSETQSLIKKMWKIMDEAGGIGLAAPQIGIKQRIIVVDCASKNEPPAPYRMINPELVSSSEEKVINEAKKKAELAYKRLGRFDYTQQCKKYEYFLNKFI